MNTRAATLLGESVVLGFSHFLNGVLADAYQMNQVILKDSNYNSVMTFNSGQIYYVGLGSYQVIVPANILNQLGTWHDAWSFIPSEGATVKNVILDVEVVNVAPQPTPSWTELSCNLIDLDACKLKKYYLWPVWSILKSGYYVEDSILNYTIDTAISFMQRRLGLPLRLMRVLTRPYADYQYPLNPVKGVDYDEDGQLIQWSAIESLQWSQVHLPHKNIVRINGLRGIYGGKTVYRIPTEWVEPNQLAIGYLRVRPTTAGALNNIVDNSGRFLDVTLLESTGAQMVPGFWAVDYTYGNGPGFEDGAIPKEICDAILSHAAVKILEQISTAITRGIASRSASVDGLSSSISYMATQQTGIFGNLATLYRERISEENLDEMKRYYAGPSIAIL